MRALRLVLLVCVLAAAGYTLFQGRCRPVQVEPIRVGEGRVVVTNLTQAAWSDVEVWLNDSYRAQAKSLAPGQRLEIPLGVFVAGFGQTFDPSRQSPRGVRVSAGTADGARVSVTWGQGRRQ